MNSFLRSVLLVLLILSTFSPDLFGQIREENPIGRNPIGTSNQIDTTDSGILPLDTPATMSYVLQVEPDRIHSIVDSFLWEDNRHHPLAFYESHLGNFGSPVRALIPIRKSFPGFRTGWDQYDPYYVTADSFRYYHQDVPVMKARFSQAGQSDTYFNLDFGRSFARGLSLSLVYNRINQVTERPPSWAFAHQQQRNTTFGIGVWHDALNGRYDAFYNFLSNGAFGLENGGVAAPELIGDTGVNNIVVPVYRLQAETSHKHRTFFTKQIFHLLPDTTSLGIDVWMQAHYETGLYKFSDPDTSGALQFYGSEFFVDPRGMRQYTFTKESQVSGGIALPWTAARSTVQASLRYRSIVLEQEPDARKINELFFDGTGEFQWIEPLKLRGKFSLGLGQAKGTFSFQADGALQTGLIGAFEGFYSIVKRHPYTVESRLRINQQIIYNTGFNDPVYHQIGISWNWQKQLLRAGVNWFVFDNYIYFNEEKKTAQITESFSLRQLFAEKTFDFRWIGIKGNFIWQPDARRELAMPDLIYTAGLYGRMKIFKKRLAVMPGVDLTYHDQFAGVDYFPATGRYHLTGGPDIPNYMRIDAVIGIHINFLKAFLRMEDVVGLWDKRVLYQADFYPHYPGYLRIGVSTGFYN